MDEIIKHCINDANLVEKYKEAEEKYYRKLGDEYEIIQIELDFEDEGIRKIFHALANVQICFDDYLTCIFKEYIVEKEMEKL